jgi:hypothetical protein
VVDIKSGPRLQPAARNLSSSGRPGRVGLLRASARLFFDTAPIDPTARRISQVLDMSPQGLSRNQIRCLFNRHVSKERIDLAREQLAGLGLLSCLTSSSGHGRLPLYGRGVAAPDSVHPCRASSGT